MLPQCPKNGNSYVVFTAKQSSILSASNPFSHLVTIVGSNTKPVFYLDEFSLNKILLQMTCKHILSANINNKLSNESNENFAVAITLL